jgi:Protein of unknown function (DUF3592)
VPSTIATFDFGPVGNRVVALLGFAFAAAFLAASSWAAWRLADLTHDVWRARGWTVAQASVLHAGMTSDREPRRLGYYGVRIKFRYALGDKEYQAGRLVFTGQSGETVDVWNGQWLARVVEFIENSRREGRPVPVFVNPADPADAVVFRDMIWGNYVMLTLVMLLFCVPLSCMVLFHLQRMGAIKATRTMALWVALPFPLFALLCAAVAAAA